MHDCTNCTSLQGRMTSPTPTKAHCTNRQNVHLQVRCTFVQSASGARRGASWCVEAKLHICTYCTLTFSRSKSGKITPQFTTVTIYITIRSLKKKYLTGVYKCNFAVKAPQFPAFQAAAPRWRLHKLHSQLFCQSCKIMLYRLIQVCDSVFVETAQ